MIEVRLTPQAEADIEAVLEYRGAYSEAAADRLVDGLDAALDHLQRFPESGSPRPELADGLSVLVLGEFSLNLFYVASVVGEEGGRYGQVLIVRVLRQEQEVTRAMLGR